MLSAQQVDRRVPRCQDHLCTGLCLQVLCWKLDPVLSIYTKLQVQPCQLPASRREDSLRSQLGLLSDNWKYELSAQNSWPREPQKQGQRIFFSLWYIYKKYYIKTQLRWKSVAELASVVVQQVKLLSPALAPRVVLAQVLWPYFQSAFLLIHLGKEWRWSKSLGLWAHRRPRGKSSSWFWPTPTVVCNWENSTLCLPVSLYYCLSNK